MYFIASYADRKMLCSVIRQYKPRICATNPMTENSPLSHNSSIETGQEILVRNAGTVIDADLTVQHRAFLAAATSENTRRAYRSAIRSVAPFMARAQSQARCSPSGCGR